MLSLIVPDGPTLLDGTSTMLIDDLDVFGYNAANSYIIPELVNVDRFKAAVARTLTIFPLYAARVSCGGDGGVPWKITLPPKGIPLTISVSQETKIAPTDTIVQKPLRFLPPLNARQIVLDPEAPLAAILLTMFPKVGATSIGITRWHPIGSDYVANRFISALSKAYQGLALDVPHPVYKAARSYLPAPDSTYLKGVDTLAVKAYYPANSTHPQLDPSQPPNVRLDFRLSAKQTQQLHDSILALGGESPSFLTLQDCIVAFIVVATNAADSSNPPIHTIDTILDVRGAASIPSELSFNGFTFAPNRVTPRDWDDYYAYAAAVRKSIMRGRDPNFLAALTDLQARSRGDKQRGDNGLGQSTRTHDMQLDAPPRRSNASIHSFWAPGEHPELCGNCAISAPSEASTPKSVSRREWGMGGQVGRDRSDFILQSVCPRFIREGSQLQDEGLRCRGRCQMGSIGIAGADIAVPSVQNELEICQKRYMARLY